MSCVKTVIIMPVFTTGILEEYSQNSQTHERT